MTELSKEKKAEIRREWRWWRIHPEKLTKLEQAFAIGCTDEEAIGYAEISRMQLNYYEKLNPEWKERKQRLKDTPILKAKQTIVNKLDESYGNAIDYLKRRKRDEFGDNMDVTTGGKPLRSNTIIFKRMDGTNKPSNPADGGGGGGGSGS